MRQNLAHKGNLLAYFPWAHTQDTNSFQNDWVWLFSFSFPISQLSLPLSSFWVGVLSSCWTKMPPMIPHSQLGSSEWLERDPQPLVWVTYMCLHHSLGLGHCTTLAYQPGPHWNPMPEFWYGWSCRTCRVEDEFCLGTRGRWENWWST